jgi:hypothetical protein
MRLNSSLPDPGPDREGWWDRDFVAAGLPEFLDPSANYTVTVDNQRLWDLIGINIDELRNNYSILDIIVYISIITILTIALTAVPWLVKERASLFRVFLEKTGNFRHNSSGQEVS